MDRTIAFALALTIGAGSAACSKEEAPAAPATSAVGATAPGASAATANAATTTTTTATTSSTAASSAPAASTPPAAPLGASNAAAKAASSAKAAPTCGDRPLPPCPLYAWMKANTSAAMSAQDFDALAVALGKVVTFAPAGYGNWASIARDGANAARVQNLDAVKAACRGCHNQYKDKYKREMRDRPI